MPQQKLTMKAQEAAACIGGNRTGLYRMTAAGKIRAVNWGNIEEGLEPTKSVAAAAAAELQQGKVRPLTPRRERFRSITLQLPVPGHSRDGQDLTPA